MLPPGLDMERMLKAAILAGGQTEARLNQETREEADRYALKWDDDQSGDVIVKLIHQYVVKPPRGGPLP